MLESVLSNSLGQHSNYSRVTRTKDLYLVKENQDTNRNTKPWRQYGLWSGSSMAQILVSLFWWPFRYSCWQAFQVIIHGQVLYILLLIPCSVSPFICWIKIRKVKYFVRKISGSWVLKWHTWITFVHIPLCKTVRRLEYIVYLYV